jgi:hypothetical protein
MKYLDDPGDLRDFSNIEEMRQSKGVFEVMHKFGRINPDLLN